MTNIQEPDPLPVTEQEMMESARKLAAIFGTGLLWNSPEASRDLATFFRFFSEKPDLFENH